VDNELESSRNEYLYEAIGEMRALVGANSDATNKVVKTVLGNGDIKESIAYKVLKAGTELEEIYKRLENIEKHLQIIDKSFDAHTKKHAERENAIPNTWPSLVWSVIKK